MSQPILFNDLGIQPYKSVWDYQEQLLQSNVAIKLANRENANSNPQETVQHLIFVEHPPVYTLGKSGKIEHLLISEEKMSEDDIAFFPINRGGDITFHGYGQLVGYPILDLEKHSTDLNWYLRNIEEIVILTLAAFDIIAERSKGETGVWIDTQKPGKERKICAIGIRCSRWITMHGFALNVNTDLSYFNNIVPCGIQNKAVTSIANELGRTVDMDLVKSLIKSNFEKVFDVELVS